MGDFSEKAKFQPDITNRAHDKKDIAATMSHGNVNVIEIIATYHHIQQMFSYLSIKNASLEM